MSANIRLILTNLVDTASNFAASAANNLLLQSRTLGTAPWGGTATVTTNTTVTDGSAVATQHISQDITVPNDTQMYTASIRWPSVAPGAPRHRLKLTLSGGATPVESDLLFDSSAPTTYQAAITGTYGSASSYRDQLARPTARATVRNNGTGHTTLTVRFEPAATTVGTFTPDVTVTGSFTATYMQVEPGDCATQPITTTAASVSGGGFLSSLPGTNLQLEGRGRVARTSNIVGSKIITGDFPRPFHYGGSSLGQTISSVVLHRHNLGEGDAFRLLLYAGESARTDKNVLYDSGPIDAVTALGWTNFNWFGNVYLPYYSVLWFAPVVDVGSFKVILGCEQSLSSYVEAKRLIIGKYFEPAVNAGVGLKLGWNEDSVQRRTQAGSIRTDPRARYRTISGGFDAFTEAERALWSDHQHTAGLRGEVFVSMFPGAANAQERDFSMLGKFGKLMPATYTRPLYPSVGFEIDEV